MVRLLLHKPASASASDDFGVAEVVKEWKSLLQRVESIIRSVMASGGRYEARLWLCSTVSCIHSIPPRDQRGLFLELLRSKPSKRDVAAQLLQMIFEKRPERAGPIIARKIYMLENFFEGNPKHILQWFDNFASTSESGHTKGSKAVSQFAFVNRDICWEELVWKGKHGQSPAVVATKPHYFQDLDVLRTVENFLDYVPSFWSSDELADSVRDGKILNIDTRYFVKQFIHLMYEENCRDIWALVEEFIVEEQFSSLSQPILILLNERGLLDFLKSAGKFIRTNAHCKDFSHSSCWLEMLLSTCNESVSLDELFVLNAAITQGRHLVRLVGDEEHEEVHREIEEISDIALTLKDAGHWGLMNECLKMEHTSALKWIGLHSWVLHYSMSRECKTPQSWESLFISNQVSFRKADGYSLVGYDGVSTENGSDIDDEDLFRAGHKKRKKDRKKRRNKFSRDDSVNDEMVDFQRSNDWQGLNTEPRSWLLSTDGYSCAWNAADLPEYLSRHYFSTWMMWVASNW